MNEEELMPITKRYTYWVYFDIKSAELLEEELLGVNQGLARGLAEHRVALESQWDSELEDLRIAQARAQAVHSYLYRNGVDQSRIDPADLHANNRSLSEEVEKYHTFVCVDFYPPPYHTISENGGNSKSLWKRLKDWWAHQNLWWPRHKQTELTPVIPHKGDLRIAARPLAQHYTHSEVIEICYRCDSPLVDVTPSDISDISFFECPSCKCQYSKKPDSELHDRWGMPITLALYGVIFANNPPSEAKVQANMFSGREDLDLELLNRHIKDELDNPKQRVSEIHNFLQPDERKLREYLKSFVEELERL